MPWSDLRPYLVHTMLLVGSMFYVSLGSSMKSALGKSIFPVLLKTGVQVTFADAVWVR
jgi:hypothetical protein